VKEAEALAELAAMGLDRTPGGFVGRVVVDHDDFVVRVVQAR